MEPGKFYHIYTHANGSENLFRSQDNYRYFLSRYDHFTGSVADTYAYCLMPNHIHFLVRIKNEMQLESTFGKFETFQKLEARISKQFANLFSGYTQAFNKMYGRQGSLFIPNFKRKEITNETYLTSVILYIHSNPLKDGFAKAYAGWPWSSYNTILNDKPTSLKREEIFGWFGNRNEFLKFHLHPDEKQLSKSSKLLESS